MALPLPEGLLFGPVPSRRLGRSLGVNHVPPKVYACLYCQVGRTTALTARVTESMRVRGAHDDPARLEALAEVVASLDPAIAWLSTPTRPPAEARVEAPPPEVLARAREIFAGRLPRVGALFEEPGDPFGGLGEATADLVGICAVHPVDEARALALLAGRGAPAEALEALVARGALAFVTHEGRRFVVAGWQRRGRGA